MAASAPGAASAGDLPQPGGVHPGDLPEELNMGSLWSSLVGDIEAPMAENPFLDDDAADEDGYLLRCFNVTTGCCAGGYGAVQGRWANIGEYLRDRRCAQGNIPQRPEVVASCIIQNSWRWWARVGRIRPGGKAASGSGAPSSAGKRSNRATSWGAGLGLGLSFANALFCRVDRPGTHPPH